MKNAVDRTHTFRSNLDTASRKRISGWAFDSATPKAQVAIVISANGQVIGHCVAEQLRPDLARAGIGDGFHAFTFDIAGKLRDDVGYRIDVTRESDGRPLDNSPAILEQIPAEPAGRLEGCLDTQTRTRLSGWAVDGDNHVGLVVTVNGRVIANILANRYRADLKDAGYGDGRHAFDVILPELSALIEHEIHVRRRADGTELPGSPLILAAAEAFDDNVQATFATLLAGIDSDANEAKASAFLAKQMDLLLARRADRESGRAAREARNLHRRRWGMLAEDDPVAASLSAPSARALVIDDQVPAAGRDAGSVAILSHMRALKALGYDVAFVAARAMQDSAGAAQLGDAEGVACYGAPFYASVEDVLNRQSGSFSVVYLHRLSNAGDYAALVRTHQPKAWIVYSVADLHHLRVARQSQVQQRSELAAFSRHLAFREFVAARFADAVITHSPVEAKMLAEKVQRAKVHVVPWTVPPRPCAVPFAKRADLAVIGQFAHPPNPDAVFWFSRQVMPLVWAEDPAIKCLVVGHDWTAASLAGSDPRIEVLGPVDDLAHIFARVRLTVAPLRFGAGIKGKVLESFAAGIPCVMSPVAAEGLDLPPPLSELIAGSAEAMASAILRMHGDAAANSATRDAGLDFIAHANSEQRVLEAITRALPGAGQGC